MYCIGLPALNVARCDWKEEDLAVAAYAGLISQDEFVDAVRATALDSNTELDNLRSADTTYFVHKLLEAYPALEHFLDPEFRRARLSPYLKAYMRFLSSTYGNSRQILEEIALAYDDFGFPEEIKAMVFFMPSITRTEPASEDAIYRDLERYLDDGQPSPRR